MLKLPNSLHDWASEELATDAFKQTLKHEIESLKAGSLPLENSISQGGHIDDSNITATILSISDNQSAIHAKAGIFFTEIVGGCNCNDDPIEINAYCEVMVNIDKNNAEAEIIAI